VTSHPDIGDLLRGLSDSEVADLVMSLPDSAIRPLEHAIPTITPRDTITIPDLARDVIGHEYIRREHTDVLMAALARAVERADRGEDTKLIISMPPGSGKSMTASVVFPLWLMLNRPEWEIGLVSAEASLATKFSGDVQREYDERATRPRRGGVTDWTIDGPERGGIIARGIKGSMSGRRLRVAIIDDPIRHMEDAYSQKIRDTSWSVWQSVIKPRMRPGSIILSIATRWHDDDLNGRLLKEDGWESIIIPALAETDDQLGREIGEPLLSVQTLETPDEALTRWEAIKLSVGSAVFNALYQQHPGELDGTVFKLEWWRFYTDAELPPADQVITAWDLTFGTATQAGSRSTTGPRGIAPAGDYCVGQAWQRTGNRYYLLDQIRFRGGFTVQLSRMRSFIARYPTAIAHVVEQAANGAAAIETLQKELDGVVPVPPTGSKLIRVSSVSPLVEAHQVHLPSGRAWLDDFLTECTAFPTAKHDDIPDTLAHALRRMRHSDVGEIDVNTDRAQRALPGW
jgi:predicted phage terminase large subunit-like protein